MKTLLAAAALVLAGAVTVRASDRPTSSGLEYAIGDPSVGHDRMAPVTGHWTKLGNCWDTLENAVVSCTFGQCLCVRGSGSERDRGVDGTP